VTLPEQPPAPPQPQPAPTPPPPSAPPPPPSPPEPRTFTQDDLNAIIAREKEQERRQVVREVSDRLGCTVEEAEQHLKDARNAELERMSEADRKVAEAELREKAAADREAAAVVRERRLRIREALVQADVRPERADMACSGVTVSDDADDEAVRAAVAEYKQQVPEFFKAAGTPPKTPPSTPASAPAPTGKPEEDRFAKGAERAKAFRG
jgi:hypothetical protein